MRQIYLAALTGLLSFAAAHAGEAPQSRVNLDIWFVSELVENLSKDDFSEREMATRRLIALGPVVITEIDEHINSERLDAESRERLQRVKRDAEFALLTTFELAAAEYERIAGEVQELGDGRYAPLISEKRARADRLLARLEAMSREQNRTLTLADMLLGTGERLYRAPASLARSPALRFAIADLQSAVYYYEQSLNAQPEKSDVRMAHNRAVTLLGLARWSDNPRFE